MSLRKLLLRLLLASLAFSAVAGVLAVLTGGREIVLRVVGTGVVAAIASGLMFALSLLIDKDRSRPAGLLGMVAVVSSFLIGLILIWNDGSDSMLWLITLLLVLGATPPLMFFTRAISAERGKWAGIVGLSGSGIAVVLFLGAIWGDAAGGSHWTVSEELAASAWAASAFGALAAGSLAGVGVDRRWWRWIGVAASAAGCTMAFIGIWKNLHDGGLAFAAITGIAVIIAHANLVLLSPLTPGQLWVRWGTIAAVILTSLLVDLIALKGDGASENDLVSRAAAATAIAAGCGTLALLVLARLNRKIATRSVPAGVKELTLICPWCQRKQALPLGASSCSGCKLKFQITVEEPHCPNCDYLLYMLTSDRCPECGTVIRAAEELEAAPPAPVI